MFIDTERINDRVKISLTHGRSNIRVSIHSSKEWELLRDRLDDTVFEKLNEDNEYASVMHCQSPSVRLNLTCDLTAVAGEDEFEESIAVVYRMMERVHPADVDLTVLVSSKMRSQFDSIEWKNRQACAREHRTTLTNAGQITEAAD